MSGTNTTRSAAADAPQDAGTTKDAGTTTSLDTFDNPDVKALASTPTSVDAAGVERIAGPPLSEFTPAPTTATDEEIAAAKARQKLFADAAKDRAALLAPAKES